MKRRRWGAYMPNDQCLTQVSALSFSNVSVSYAGRTIFSDMSFNVPRGEFACVIGPSGCGKTTVLRVAAGLVTPSRGAVQFEGQPLVGPRRDMAVVFQDYGRALLPWRDVYGNVSLAMEAADVPRPERSDRIHELLKIVGLRDQSKKFPGQMSGGMQQRLQIARCLAQEPRVLLMDEPFGALDAMTRQLLQDEILSIAAGRDMTVLFVTHDLEEALYLGNQVIALAANPGRIDRIVEVALPSPRHQLSTRENAEFLRLRRDLYGLMQGEHA